MMGLKELLRSGRGFFCLSVLLLSTLYVFLGMMTVNDWISYTKWIATVLVISRTVTHVRNRVPTAKIEKEGI